MEEIAIYLEFCVLSGLALVDRALEFAATHKSFRINRIAFPRDLIYKENVKVSI